jgi:hypothetical protein
MLFFNIRNNCVKICSTKGDSKKPVQISNQKQWQQEMLNNLLSQNRSYWPDLIIQWKRK